MYPKPQYKRARVWKKNADGRRMIVWHKTICARAKDEDSGMYRCFHCKRLFPHNEVCGDHFPHTRSERPDLKYDLSNGVCSCMSCNQSGSPTRKRSKLNWET